MNFGKRATNKKRNALTSRSSMLGKKSTCFFSTYYFHLSDGNFDYRRLHGYRCF